MITNRIPETWRDLQDEVARILRESGFEVETEVRRTSGRGSVECDIFGYEEIKGRRYSVVCECKHWRTRVPQNVIHSFRTVVAEIGANLGYIVSLAGFQSGAFEAARLTNIKLLTWEEFQNEFEESWHINFFSPKIAKDLDPLLTYTEPLLPAWFPDLSEGHKKQYFELKDRYDEFGWMMMSFTPYVRMLKAVPIPQLPVIGQIKEDSPMRANVPMEILTCATYREFLELSIEFGSEVIRQFREIRTTVVVDESEHE